MSDPTWPFSFVDAVRYGDLDANGHLNNVVFLQLFEDARIAYLRSLNDALDVVTPQAGTGMIFAEAHLHYRAPAFYPEQIRTHVRPDVLRRSSIRVAFRMTSEADGRLLAEGWGTMVGYDYDAGRATPLHPDLRDRLLADGATPEDPDA